MKKPALTPYDIGEIMAARLHGATCKTLGERYGRSAEAIRQLVLRYTEGNSKGAVRGNPYSERKRNSHRSWV